MATMAQRLTSALLLLVPACAGDAAEDTKDTKDMEDMEGTTRGDGKGEGDGVVVERTTPFSCPGGVIAPGANAMSVRGEERHLLADFPADLSGPLGILFSWHGVGDNATDFKDLVGLDPDAVPSLPLVVVTPEDSGLQPPAGLDWDILGGTADAGNVDLAFFEAIVGCLDEQFDIDPKAVYSFGFSSGSVMTNLLQSSYPDMIGATVTESGAWFNDPSQADLVKLLDVDWNWPALDPADGGAVLITRGGPTGVPGLDLLDLDLLDLENAAQAALPFLTSAGRVVVDCVSTIGATRCTRTSRRP